MFLIHFRHNMKWRMTSTITSIFGLEGSVHVSMCSWRCLHHQDNPFRWQTADPSTHKLHVSLHFNSCVSSRGGECVCESVSVMAFFKFTSQRVQPMVWQGLKGHKGQWQLGFIQCSKIQHSLNVSGRTHTDRLTISFNSPGAVKLDVTLSTALNAASNDSFSVTSA